MTTSSYKVGDVLLCHKHIGVAKFVGKLHGQDYQQLSSQSQVYIKESDIWVGLQLAEQPNIRNLSLMKPHSKHKKLRSISYECLNAISFLDYFTANYGLLIPRKYIHRKINAHQILTKLTQIFHTLKKTQKRNISLTKKVKKLQSELQTKFNQKKVKSTSQKSLKSVIYDQNGNSYHHHQKITHTTTHSYKSFKKTDKNDSENESVSLISNTDQNTASLPTTPIKATHHKKRASQKRKLTLQSSSASASASASHSHTHSQSSKSKSLSDKAVEAKENFSDRNMSDCDENINVDEPPILTEKSHIRRYSAPYKEFGNAVGTQQFGSDYDKLNDPYWKNSGNRHTDMKEEYGSYDVLPQIKENPKTEQIYLYTKFKQNQQNIRERHKRSMSMSVVNVPRYVFDIDDEYPDLPDL